MKIDHHIHTSRYSPDSVIDPLDLLEQAREVGLDGVVITEHDHQWEAEELAELNAHAPELLVLSGAEVSTREGHFLVYGLPDLRDVPAGIRLKDLLKVVQAHRAAVVAAHPFRWDQDFEGIVAAHGAVFDALEMVSNNVTSGMRSRIDSILDRHPMGATGSSDAHALDVVGCYYTRFNCRIETIADFVAALHDRSGRPGHRSGTRLTSGPMV